VSELYIYQNSRCNNKKNTYTHTYTYTQSARNSKTANYYLIAKSKLSELLLDVRVYAVSDIGSDHLLTLAKLRFPPKLLHLPQNTARK